MANIERVCAGDIRGCALFLFPGNHASSMALKVRSSIGRSWLMRTVPWNSRMGLRCPSPVPIFQHVLAAMGALNDVQLRHLKCQTPH
jgi:hypothetical protein